ncbi:hypothetical protein EC968_010408 [Mortierella alpina]|nr:hypothetical protein EC968_010408 [Mortierella alpina]
MIFANMQLATANIEDVINAAEYYTNFIGTGTSSAIPPAPPRHNPNDMELDHLAISGLDNHALQVVVNAIKQAQQHQPNHHQQRQYRPNNQQRSRPNNYNRNNTNNQWAHLPPLTPAERQRLIDTGGCFKCRKGGHQGWQGLCANFIGINEGASFSGNAPSGQA